jgi:hypothetical protein
MSGAHLRHSISVDKAGKQGNRNKHSVGVSHRWDHLHALKSITQYSIY